MAKLVKQPSVVVPGLFTVLLLSPVLAALNFRDRRRLQRQIALNRSRMEAYYATVGRRCLSEH